MENWTVEKGTMKSFNGNYGYKRIYIDFSNHTIWCRTYDSWNSYSQYNSDTIREVHIDYDIVLSTRRALNIPESKPFTREELVQMVVQGFANMNAFR